MEKQKNIMRTVRRLVERSVDDGEREKKVVNIVLNVHRNRTAY